MTLTGSNTSSYRIRHNIEMFLCIFLFDVLLFSYRRPVGEMFASLGVIGIMIYGAIEKRHAGS